MSIVNYKNLIIGTISNANINLEAGSHYYQDAFCRISNWFTWLDEKVKISMNYGRFDFDNEESSKQELIRQFEFYLDFITKTLSNKECVKAYISSTNKEIDIKTGNINQPGIYSVLPPNKIDILYNGFKICTTARIVRGLTDIQENYIDSSFLANNKQFRFIDGNYSFKNCSTFKDVAVVVKRKFESYCSILLNS